MKHLKYCKARTNEMNETDKGSKTSQATSLNMHSFDYLSVPDGVEVPADESQRRSIWKTVEYVIRNGATYEEKLKSQDIGFTQPGNKYNDYYAFLLEHQRSRQDTLVSTKNELDRKPSEPYPFVYSTYRNDIGQKDLELIKAAAHFCVINNDINYLEKLRERYAEDPRFAFLRLDHSLNSVLTDFINQYEQILSEEYGPIVRLEGPLQSTILRRAFQKAEYMELQDELKQKMKADIKTSRIRFSAYEWEKFELVGTVTISEEENLEQLPEALNFDILKATKLTNDVDIFKTEDVSAAAQKRKRKNMNIRKAGETRLKKKSGLSNTSEHMLKCPITGRLVPEPDFDSHLKILLSDPECKEVRDKYESKHKLTNLSTSEVYENIKRIVSQDNANPVKRQKI